MNITHENAVELIRKIVKEKGSQVAAAKHLNISPAYLGDILKGARPVSGQVARKLGFQRVISYQKMGA